MTSGTSTSPVRDPNPPMRDTGFHHHPLNAVPRLRFGPRWAGFPKPHAYWYSANWLQAFGPSEPGRPPLPFKTVARILELPEPPGTGGGGTGGGISGVTTAPFAALFLDGVSLGVLPTVRNGRGEVLCPSPPLQGHPENQTHCGWVRLGGGCCTEAGGKLSWKSRRGGRNRCNRPSGPSRTSRLQRTG